VGTPEQGSQTAPRYRRHRSELASITRLIGAVLLKQSDGRLPQHRSRQVKEMAEFAPPPIDADPAKLHPGQPEPSATSSLTRLSTTATDAAKIEDLAKRWRFIVRIHWTLTMTSAMATASRIGFDRCRRSGRRSTRKRASRRSGVCTNCVNRR
jgi:hypothetical protein